MVDLAPVQTGDPHVAAHNAERTAINDLTDVVDGKMPLPKNPLVGQHIRWNGTSWQPSVTRYFEGEGDPNGQVAAPIGSRYVDLTPNSPAVEWLKATGTSTSNTGWVRPGVYDSGFRNISALVQTRGTATVYTAMLARYGNVVDLYLDLKVPTDLTSPWVALTLPIGFRPPFTRWGALNEDVGTMAGSMNIGLDGTVNFLTLSSAKRDRFAGTWITRDPVPTELPGAALA